MRRTNRKLLLLCFVLAALLCLMVFAAGAQNNVVFDPDPAPYFCYFCTQGTFNGSPACLEEGKLHVCDKNFPDVSFRRYIFEQYDGDGDYRLTEEDVLKVEEINCSAGSLQGIAYFTNLRSLNCYGGSLTAIDLSRNTKLVSLNCGYNDLTQLDVSACPALQELSCNNNQLTALDFSNNPKLVKLSCRYNQLIELDINNNSELRELELGKQRYELEAALETNQDGTSFNISQIVGQENLANVTSVNVNYEPAIFDAATGKVKYEHTGSGADIYLAVPYTSPYLTEPMLCIRLTLDCEHVWDNNGDCTNRSKCTICGAHKKGRSDHSWNREDVDCSTLPVCRLCGTVSKEPINHKWASATCTAPMTCTVCGVEEGEPMGHRWRRNSLGEKVCRRCDAVNQEAENDPVAILMLTDAAVVCAVYLALAIYMIRKNRWGQTPIVYEASSINRERNCHDFQGNDMPLIYVICGKSHREFAIYEKPAKGKEFEL